jgi:hypothetical protein
VDDAAARTLFVRRAEELLDLPLIRSGGLATSLNFRAGEGIPPQLTTTRPHEEPFRSFLLTFRLFMAPKEPTFVNSISNGLRKDLEGGRVRDLLDEQRSRWKRASKTGSLRVVVNETAIEPQELLDCLINGRYFHSDERKAKRLEALERAGAPFTDQILFDHVIAATNYIGFLGSLIIDVRRDGLID